MQITNALRKLVYSLGESKHRRSTGLFKVEGSKGVVDMLPYFEVEMLFADKAWLSSHSVTINNEKICEVSRADLERMSHLKTAPQVIAVMRIPETGEADTDGLMLALDCVQDPGNLGTIIRTADWFGIHHIFASPDTADVWSPKVVQATMGSLARVKVHYSNLPTILETLKADGKTIYGTFLGGENIFTTALDDNSVIVMGNEGKGISDEVAQQITHRITIPSFPASSQSAESLNVAVATAITISQFRAKQVTNG